MKKEPEPSECPYCDTDFTGAPIPKEQQWLFGNATHFLQGVVGVYSREKDATVAWRCLSCNAEWPRK